MKGDHIADGPTSPAYEPVLTSDDEPALPSSGVPEHLSGTLEVEESAEESATEAGAHLSAWMYESGRAPRRVALADLGEARPARDAFLWVQIWGYSPEDLRDLADRLHLDGAAVDVALDAWQRPRLDIAPTGYFVNVTLPRVDVAAHRVFAGEIDLFVGRNLLVTAHKQPPVLSKRVRARARLMPDALREEPSYLVYIILDELLAYYERLCEHVDDEVEVLEERALTDTTDAYLGDVLRLKRYVFALSRLADHHRDVLASFLRPDFPFQAPDVVRPYFRQLNERLAHALAVLADAKAGVNGAFTIYVSHVSHRTSRIIRTLTVISGLLLPVTVILAFFSAVAQIAPIYRGTGLVLMVLCILTTGLVGVWIFERKQWIHLRPRAQRADTPLADVMEEDADDED